MFATTAHRRTLAAAAVLSAACFGLAAPAAVASPQLAPQPADAGGCQIDVHDFAAQLRAAGFTAQAANVATAMTVRDCLGTL